MKTFLVIIMLSLLSLISIFAQNTTQQQVNEPSGEEYEWHPDTTQKTNIFDNGFGIRYSTISGYGISFLRRFFEDYTVCLTGMIIYDQNTQWSDMTKQEKTIDEKDILYDWGLEVQRDIFTSYNTKFYALIGFYNWVRDNTDSINEYKKEDAISLGAGLGFQWYMGTRVAVYFQFGYKFEDKDIDERGKPGIARKTAIGYGAGIVLLF